MLRVGGLTGHRCHMAHVAAREGRQQRKQRRLQYGSCQINLNSRAWRQGLAGGLTGQCGWYEMIVDSDAK